MNSIVRISRIHLALLVIQQVEEGVTVVQACRSVGLSRRSYYEICKRRPDIIANFQQRMEETDREQLCMILARHNAILEKILEEGLASSTKPLERLAIYKTLNAHLDKLVEDLRLDQQGNGRSEEMLLSGPILHPGVSRLTLSRELKPEGLWQGV